MLNITLDTCVWLELLKIDFANEGNYLEEFCFWIENRHLNHIVPINIIDEWNRHKLGYQNSISAYFKRKEQENIILFKHNTELSSTYQAEEITKAVQHRIERIDAILTVLSEKAPYDDAILNEAAMINLRTIAPNHKKDSFRDTVNILSLISYLKKKSYTDSIFTTLNYKDFSVDGDRFKLHDGLKTKFESINLIYEYFGENENFGTRLFNILRKQLEKNSFQVYLKYKKDQREAAELDAKKMVVVKTVESPDIDFLDNIKYLDDILSKRKRTPVDEEIIKLITNRHESYKQYFLKNIGNNGLV